MENIANTFLQTAIKQFLFYKNLGDKTFVQLQNDDFNYAPNAASNSIAIIIQHLSGNMLSRWTNFLTEDGEKEWRNRDAEFENISLTSAQLLAAWEEGWHCMFDVLSTLKEEDLLKVIFIRSQPQSVLEAIHRQLAHYSYHIGQIVYIGRIIKNDAWQQLSIAKGASATYNHQLAKK